MELIFRYSDLIILLPFYVLSQLTEHCSMIKQTVTFIYEASLD